MPLRMIGFQEPVSAPAIDRRRQFPAQIDRVLDRRVVSEPARRREQMSGISGDEQAPLLQPLGDQCKSGPPRGPGNDVEVHLLSHALGKHPARLDFRDVVPILAGLELGVKDEFRISVDSHKEASPPMIHIDVHPCGFAAHVLVYFPAPEIDGVHVSAGEIPLYARFSLVLDAHMVSHDASGAVAADEVPGGERHLAPLVNGCCRDMIAVVGDRRHRVLITQPDRRQFFRLLTENPFDVHLRYPVRQLRRAPGPRELLDEPRRFLGGRELKPRQFVPRERRVVGDIGGVVPGQTHCPHLSGKTQPAVMLHRPGLGGVGLRVDGRGDIVIQQHGSDAAPAKLVGEHQPGRTAADDDNVRYRLVRGIHVRRPFPMIISGRITAAPGPTGRGS